jgi:hypothetical protein
VIFKSLIVAGAILIAQGCTSSGVIPVGGEKLMPAPAGSAVFVYSSDAQVGKPFKVIGIISYTNPGKYQIKSLNDVIPEIRDLAREAGANGVIIDESHVVKSGIISTGIGVSGRAILISLESQPTASR